MNKMFVFVSVDEGNDHMPIRLHYRDVIRSFLFRLLFFIAALVISFYIGNKVVSPTSIRALLGYCLIFLTVAIGIRKPQATILLLMIYLPLLGLIRRILIPMAGWGAFDPLVLVGPVSALLLGTYWFHHRFVMREEFQDDTPLFRSVRWLLVIDLLEVANPKQGSLMVGIGGIMFYVVPLFWFVAGRTFLNEKHMKAIIHTTFVMALVAAAYGIKQTFFGFYPFEQQWIDIVHITALHVGNQYRAISTLDNPQEYAEFLALAIVIAWIYILQGGMVMKSIGAIGAAVIGYALFMESARGPLILGAVAIAVVTVLSVKSLRAKITMGIIVGFILTGLIILISHTQPSNNALVSHQIEGITGQNSSFLGHLATMFSGIGRGIKSVIGYGLGSTTTAASKFSSSNSGTEADFSNMFVSGGLVGGVMYVIVMVRMFIVAFRQSRTRSLVGLFAVGVLLATFEQWINGELYAVVAVLWTTIGYVDKGTRTEPHWQLAEKDIDK